MRSSLVFQPMDQASLKNSDVLVLTGLTQIPTANPDGMVGEFCSNLGMCAPPAFWRMRFQFSFRYLASVECFAPSLQDAHPLMPLLRPFGD